jgi:transcriptional regulator with XRE-family HTH domain
MASLFLYLSDINLIYLEDNIIMDLIKIGQRIKQCRKAKHLTQEQFAESVNLSPHYIYEIEHGLKTMSIYTLNDIAVSLGESVDYLLYGDSHNSNIQPSADRLEVLVEKIPYKKREAVADMLQAILPHLK